MRAGDGTGGTGRQSPSAPDSCWHQQLGAGILLVPGVLTDTLMLTVCLFLWLNDDARTGTLRRRASQVAVR